MAIDMNQIMQLLQDPNVRQLVGSLMGKMGGPQGDQLNGLLDQLSKSGLGDQVNSWIGSGQNAQVSPQQLTEALGGQEQLDQMAQQAGVAPDAAAQDLAQVLPQLVNAATPNGQMPTSSDMNQLLQQLMGSAPSGQSGM